MTNSRLFRALILSMMSFAGVLASFVLTGMAPEPDPVPRRWELDVTIGPMRVTTIDAPGVGPKSYYYLTYRVVNATGEDRLFAPMWELSDGAGPVVRSGREIPRAVTDKLMAETQNSFIEDQISAVGTILQGQDNAKDGIVIWQANDTAPEKLTVYAAGFSGETKTIMLPGTKTKAVLRKSLEMDYQTPGDVVGQGLTPLELKSKRWIMR